MKKVRSLGGVIEYALPNGLRVLHTCDKTAPVVGVCVTYHVGSRNERPGHTGATHILEHLMFKDSKKFKKAKGTSITEYLESIGAQMNATTSLDRTNYFEVVPREHAEKALAVEADRMRGSLFTDADLASEMTVVRNEYERSRNNPYELLNEAVLETAFTVHPYRIPTIGSKEDIEASTAATLRTFYDRFYWPNNATLQIFGDIKKLEMERLVETYFARIPASKHTIPTMDTIEPPQMQTQTVSIEKPMGVNVVEIGHKTPAAREQDFMAIQYLLTILAGSFSARLQRTLVDTGLASSIYLMPLPTYDPGITSIIVTLTDKATHAEVAHSVVEEIEKIQTQGVSASEYRNAQLRIQSQIAQERDGIMNELMGVSESVAAGDWALFYRAQEMSDSVSRKDIQRVAQTYFTESHCTIGNLINTL